LDISIDLLHDPSYRVAAALNDSGKPMIREHSLPLVIVCSPFEKGNGCLAPEVDVWDGPEELELTWGPDNNFEVFKHITNPFLCWK